MRSRIHLGLRCALALGAFVVTPLPAQDPDAAQPIPLRAAEPGARVAVTPSATPEALVLDLVVDDGWHLYGRDVGGGQPVQVEILDGSSFAAAGPLEASPVDPQGQITGRATLVLPLRRVAPGASLRATFSYMACDPLMCTPPQTVSIGPPDETAGADELSVLLVVTEEGERSARIAELLSGRGFRSTVATYPDVTAEQCDAHDVVLADSPYFAQSRGSAQYARAFPKTDSPIVAVGFLGTLLIEAHGLAMTSGYI